MHVNRHRPVVLMVDLPIKKQEFLGAVTLVSFSVDGSLLYVGVGPTVFLYATATGELVGEHSVLTRGILHGCDVVRLPGTDTEVFVGAFFGQKRVACFKNLPQTPKAARELEGLTVLGKPKVFCDWVFDVQLLTDDLTPEKKEENKELLVAVGLAHNLVQVWDPLHNVILRSVQCAERCILYALAFHGRALDELVVASGTVFQQILLWDPMQNGGEDTDSAVEPAQRLHAHDGVLFKLTWSSDARALASVSDDRTVQLWSNNGKTTVKQLQAPRTASRAELLANEYSPVFRAWGHSARIWDVSFWEHGVVTASEDALCKLWDLDGKCVATLQGHMGRHVWRAAVHPSQKMIATGGGDGATKLWDITRQLMSASDAIETSDWSKTIRVPFATPASLTKKKKGSQSHSVRNIVLSPQDNGKTAFVASEHGEIFRLDLPSLTAELFFTIPPIDDAPVQTRTGGLSTFAIDSSGRFLLLGDVSGRVCVVEASTGNLLHSWAAHANVRIMKIWWDQDDALFVSSASGILSEWKLSIAEENENPVLPSITVELVAMFKIPAKSSTSSILVVDRSATRNVIGGDGHGSVYIFHRQLDVTESGDNISVARNPAVVLKGVHGRELVASLLLSEEVGSAQGQHAVMFSGGHDGYVCSFALEKDASGALTATQVGRESIRGISTVKRLWWGSSSSDDNTKRDLMVFGFHAAQAVLHNFSAQYRVFNVECGGWRRPHALFTSAHENGSSLPSHTFVFTPPSTQKQQVDIKVHSTLLGIANPSETSPLFSRCSLHDQHHGRMTTCVAFLGNDRLITAAEDNSLMLHRRRARNGRDKSKSWRWSSVATGIAHTTTVRALTTFWRKNDDGVEEHIVLSGGGKQRLKVWLVRGESDLLRHVCGQERADAEQDHRILGLATFAIPSVSDAYRLVTACNSEGSTQLLLLDVNHCKLYELGDCRSTSRKPILSCVGFQEDGVAGLAVGSTDGLVTLWDLSALLKEIASLLQSNKDLDLFNAKLIVVISRMQPSGSYLAHDMGTNCINLVKCAKSEEEGSLDVTFISGGDDQNLSLREMRFPSCQKLSEARTVNASGSAIKTVACLDAQVIFAAGYDQRVSKWIIRRNDNDTQMEWRGAAFSECADIADLDIRQAPTIEADEVVVVGQGLHMMQFQRE
ncbi:hypothetical protein PF001_g4466 [Phytophthora fragariae]|uniref:Uncharacterized protein n=1 Tax=Phytophthora fragariae TaxID=53985 RepID=A0A6A4E9U6_9STRA|nr:hypothetical protein PF001_g4466 [Phytophthora fragariae]